MSNPTWIHQDHWKMRADTFTVEVVRWSDGPIDPQNDFWKGRKGEHHWNVYAYVYPKHRIFPTLCDEAARSNVESCFPFHYGSTYCKPNFNEKKEITSWKIGSDYDHLHDDHFSFQSTKEAAFVQFLDAENLFDWLENQNELEAEINSEKIVVEL